MKNVGAAVAETIAERGKWSPEETSNLIEILIRTCGQPDQPQLLVDVGCNVGWFCSVAAAYGCKCMAFDGNYEAVTYVRMTAALNGWSGRVEARAALVTNDSSVVFDGWEVVRPGSNVTSRTNASDSLATAARMPSIRLDDVLSEPAVFMKIDVEGWEVSVFESAMKYIAATPPRYIFFETTHYLKGEWITTYAKVLLFISQNGYRCAQTRDPKRIPNLASEAAAAEWFNTLKLSPICDTANMGGRWRCQEEIFCVHSSTSFVPSGHAKLFS